MLYLAAYEGRERMQMTEATNVAYGVDLDPQIFACPQTEFTPTNATDQLQR
jgi:hypothetical protein